MYFVHMHNKLQNWNNVLDIVYVILISSRLLISSKFSFGEKQWIYWGSSNKTDEILTYIKLGCTLIDK